MQSFEFMASYLIDVTMYATGRLCVLANEGPYLSGGGSCKPVGAAMKLYHAF